MTDTATAPPSTPVARRIGLLKIALVVSLALNLVFIGAAAARYFVGGPPERMPYMSQMQFFPRKFFGELDRGRRLELLKVFKDYGPEFREGRRKSREEIVDLAAALEAEPYDQARVQAAVDAFSANGTRLMTTGGRAAMTLIAKLTPEERKLLARHIRQREEGSRRDHLKRGERDND
jgi:Spy/CpxP family protein refolding chaperone